jgi:hypothetical protein
MIMFLLKPDTPACGKQVTPFTMGIFSKRRKNQVAVLMAEHPATVKTLDHFLVSSWRPIDKESSLAVSTATQYSVAVKEPIPHNHLKNPFRYSITSSGMKRVWALND